MSYIVALPVVLMRKANAHVQCSSSNFTLLLGKNVQVTGTARNVLILTVDDLMLALISSIVVEAMRGMLPLQSTSFTHEITRGPN